jgi:hypothetical protein
LRIANVTLNRRRRVGLVGVDPSTKARGLDRPSNAKRLPASAQILRYPHALSSRVIAENCFRGRPEL